MTPPPATPVGPSDARARRAPWLVIAVVFFTGTLAFHLPVTDLCDALARRYGFVLYDRVVSVAAAGLGALALATLGRRARGRPRLLAALGVLACAAVLAQGRLIVASVETVHYPQYAVLAALLVRGGLGLETAWAVATMLGVIDETFQYLVLPRGTFDYLDWNDIVLNALGAALGLVALLAWTGRVVARCMVPRSVALAAVLVVLAMVPPAGGTTRTTPEGRRYHVMSAVEGVGGLLLAGLSVRFLACAPLRMRT
jgi:hypothetical protein